MNNVPIINYETRTLTKGGKPLLAYTVGRGTYRGQSFDVYEPDSFEPEPDSPDDATAHWSAVPKPKFERFYAYGGETADEAVAALCEAVDRHLAARLYADTHR